MTVKLIGITKPAESTGCETANDLIAYTARVSNPTNQMNLETAPKLLKYLIQHQHWSPFECVSLTLEINTTRDIARQILRHRSFSFQEFSQRYADPTQELGFALREARMQDPKNRQNSLPTTDFTLDDMWTIRQNKVLAQVREAYKWAIDNGIAKEQARAVLPEGLTQSRLYMAGTLRSWIHYCELRTANGTQLEHQEIAKDCWKIIAKEFPDVAEAVNIGDTHER